ncbi:MAG: type II toxin-antitoxin system RelE/ParE family toxin [Clostridiales bacterium]|nr:type II toxin-antitoxin system RelE/ParE family toxin [Clostridiales bacterium]
MSCKRKVYNDLEGIKQYFRKKCAEDAFEKLKVEIWKTCEHLDAFPRAGTPVRLPQYSDFWFLIVKSYYVFYTISKNTVTVERIIHTARDLKKALAYFKV